jgi:methylenetetrahydrofolate dehydrogenase (NADP+)/methenyltetrahydrofolate cyclohydrolase
MTLLLSRNADPGNCTVTLCHSRTQNLHEIARSADILIAAIGRPHFVTADMVKPGAVVIDVGINRIPDSSKKSGSRLTGDVDAEALSDIDGYITPVPGGVGPMTIAMLLKNTLEATPTS